jgi:hypothetical protein
MLRSRITPMLETDVPDRWLGMSSQFLPLSCNARQCLLLAQSPYVGCKTSDTKSIFTRLITREEFLTIQPVLQETRGLYLLYNCMLPLFLWGNYYSAIPTSKNILHLCYKDQCSNDTLIYFDVPHKTRTNGCSHLVMLYGEQCCPSSWLHQQPRLVSVAPSPH